MKLKKTHKYDDIIHLPRPVSGKRARMLEINRAAQFAPFAALTGFEAAIQEMGRLTDSRMELEEEELQLLQAQMQAVLNVLHTRPKVQVTWFCHDQRKAGGSYITTTGHAKRIDLYNGQLLLTDGQTIPLDEIFSIVLDQSQKC